MEYKKLIFSVIHILRNDSNSTAIKNDEEIEDMLDFETRLARISIPVENLPRNLLRYNLMSVEQLSKEFPFVIMKFFYYLNILHVTSHYMTVYILFCS